MNGQLLLKEHEKEVLDKLFVHDCDKHPLLEDLHITLKLTQRTEKLYGFAKLLLYFKDNFKQFFGQATEHQSRLKHLKRIVIEFDYENDCKTITPHKYVAGSHLLFDSEPNQHYSIDEEVIGINLNRKRKYNTEFFGIIYQNVVDWLARIKESSSSHKKCSIKGRGVTFNFNRAQHM